MRPAPQGRGYRVRKRSNHVTLIVDVKVAEDTLARVGDEDTIALLQQSAAKGMVICVNNPDDPDGKKELANLIARIRNRVDK